MSELTGLPSWSAPFKLTDDLHKAPSDRGGLYAFYARFPSDRELGFCDPRISIAEVRENISSQMVYFLKPHFDRSYNGLLVDKRKSKHLRQNLIISGRTDSLEKRTAHILKIMASLTSKQDLQILTLSVRELSTNLPPIYIGMTAEQSLRTRIGQHLSGQTGFSHRLTESGMYIHDIDFRYIPTTSAFNLLLPKIERILQSAYRPILSEA